MAYICEECGKEFKTLASLGSHMRVHKGAKAKANNGEVIVRVLVEQAPIESRQYDVPPNPYKCPECGGELSLAGDGVGNYQLRCLRCWNQV
jgi:hypothetical protein